MNMFLLEKRICALYSYVESPVFEKMWKTISRRMVGSIAFVGIGGSRKGGGGLVVRVSNCTLNCVCREKE